MNGKIVSKARQVRLNHAAKLGRPITIAEVADAIGITRSALSNIEIGFSMPGAKVLAKLCWYYGVGVSDLLEYQVSELPDVVESEGKKKPVLMSRPRTSSTRETANQRKAA